MIGVLILLMIGIWLEYKVFDAVINAKYYIHSTPTEWSDPTRVVPHLKREPESVSEWHNHSCNHIDPIIGTLHRCTLPNDIHGHFRSREYGM